MSSRRSRNRTLSSDGGESSGGEGDVELRMEAAGADQEEEVRIIVFNGFNFKKCFFYFFFFARASIWPQMSFHDLFRTPSKLSSKKK